MVTGVLPVALEEATKALPVFIHSGKEYVCLMQLHEDLPEEDIRKILEEFTGEIYQKPPVRASVKRTIRKRRIYRINLLEIDGRRVLFKVACQAGTYIRKLCSDIGEALGCGAHMRELRRTRTGPFTEDEHNCTLQELQEAKRRLTEENDEQMLRIMIRPVEEAFKHIPKIYVRDSAVDAICHGAELAIPGIVRLETGIEPEEPVAIMTLKGEVVALGEATMSTEKIMEADRGVAAKTRRVIMRAGTYPKEWKGRGR
ncbi:MAG: RNA-guided pseudouridylation complex pseudouridine synthase subunit Cbf5 [Candidatus Bathyarchaeia archaeon]